MLTLITLQAEISGSVSTWGYVLGGIGVVVAVVVLYLCIRLFRAKKSNLDG
jgi:hypothetical protein